MRTDVRLYFHVRNTTTHAAKILPTPPQKWLKSPKNGLCGDAERYCRNKAGEKRHRAKETKNAIFTRWLMSGSKILLPLQWKSGQRHLECQRRGLQQCKLKNPVSTVKKSGFFVGFGAKTEQKTLYNAL
ncbi:MAG: hypothetical protein IKI66_04220 [Bacteroidales bacterium]|nr:hypothetical protein [Bacteroidales bacterium]